jgi:hypothetical protein
MNAEFDLFEVVKQSKAFFYHIEILSLNKSQNANFN